MATAHFITADYFKERVQTTANAGSIRNAIETAMRLHVRPVLGQALYNDLIAKVAAGTITGGTDQHLMQEYVKPLTREYTQLELMMVKSFKLEDTGLYQNTPDGLTPLDITQLKYFRQSIESMAQTLARDTVKYLVDNSASFPVYASNDQTPDPSAGDEFFIGIS